MSKCHIVGNHIQRHKCLTAKLVKQDNGYHKAKEDISKFYRRHPELVSKFNVPLKSFYIKAYQNQNLMAT